MLSSSSLNEISNIPPPIQPWLEIGVSNFQQSLNKINNVSQKSQALFYQFHTYDDTKNNTIIELPDACINILFELSENSTSAIIRGLYDRPSLIILKPNTEYFGIKPYSTFGMKGWKIHPSQLYNNSVALTAALIDCDIIDNLQYKMDFNEKINLFVDHYTQYWLNQMYTPNIKEYYSLLLCVTKGEESISKLEIVTGYSDRYCRKSFKSLYNCTPKTYLRIIRFQTSLHRLLFSFDSNDQIRDIAYDLGYSDEAHFINEFKYFSGLTPNNFRKCFRSYIQHTST